MPTRRASLQAERGFTLIEVLIVFAVIAIITAIAIPAMGFAIDRSKQMATMSDMRSLGVAVTQYYLDLSFYPNGSLTAAQLHLIGTDMLGYAAGFAAGYVGFAQGIKQRGFTVIDVTHDGHDRRARLQFVG